MKLLFDQNLSHRLCALLADVFPGSEQVRRAALDRAADTDIWAFAAREEFIVVSLDADFAEIAASRVAPPKVIWLRCGNQTTAFIARLLRDNASLIAGFAADDEAACLELY